MSYSLYGNRYGNNGSYSGASYGGSSVYGSSSSLGSGHYSGAPSYTSGLPPTYGGYSSLSHGVNIPSSSLSPGGYQTAPLSPGLSASYGSGGFGSGYSSRSSSTSSLRDAGDTSRYGSNRHSDISGSSYDTSSARAYPRGGDRPSSYHAGSGYSRSQSSTSLPDRDIDYKRLYEEQKAENEKLRKDVKKLQQELSDTKVDLEKVRLRSEPSRNSETAAERKEKRTLERKISELEEELRQMENLKQDNQRLKEENGALIRVISKLSK